MPRSGCALRAAAAIVLAAATAAAEPAPAGPWLRPLSRVLVHLTAVREPARTYATLQRLRDVTGVVSAACERREGRPCGDGLGAFTELDTLAGYGRRVTAGTRVRAVGGLNAYAPRLVLDRAFVRAELGPIAAAAGRDVVLAGPAARTRLAWSDHAPPLDHVRVETRAPIALTSSLAVSAGWVVGRLRGPQTFPGTLVSLARGRLDVGGVELGATQLLQLGGDGAPALGVAGFLREHVTRGDASAGATDTSNRRIGLDVTAPIAGARVYYAVMFEDWRDRFHHALRYDADHLLGAEVVTPRRDVIVVELLSTGVRSQEHRPRTTGFTNRGAVVGSPLGPDAVGVYAGARFAIGRRVVAPWVELARLSSDTYAFVVDGPILHTARGVDEERYRVGVRAGQPLPGGVRVELEALYEHVADFGFVAGARRDNLALGATLVWSPPWGLGILGAR